MSIVESDLLVQFASESIDGTLAGFETAAGECPSGSGRELEAHEQDRRARAEDDGPRGRPDP